MEYLTTFFVGLISFLSPCMLPMLPIYLSYFSKEQSNKARTFVSSLCFVVGFALVFCALGLCVGSLGALLSRFHEIVEIICGSIIVVLGLNTLGLFHFPHGKEVHASPKVTGYVSAFFFGVAFSVSHLPCVGAFLGTALATAGVSGSVADAVLLLLTYSLGMGIPFLISALLIGKIEPVIKKVKENHHSINIICGFFLIVLGILMITDLLHHLLHAA